MITQEKMNVWYKAREDLAKLKAHEMMLRKELVYVIAGTQLPTTFNKEFFGYEVKGVSKLSYKINKPLLLAATNLTEEEKTAIKWEPSVIPGKYEKLKLKSNLKSNIVTTKPGSVTLTVVSILEE